MKFFAKVRDQRGVVGLLAVLVYSGAILIIGTSLATSSITNYRASNKRIDSTQSLYAAESGAEDMLLQLRRNPTYGLAETTLTTQFAANQSSETTINANATNTCPTARQITSAGTVKTLVRRVRLSNCAAPSLADLSFGYAVQVDKGGIFLENNAVINGSVYSNGNIDGSNGVSITGAVTVGRASLVDPAVSHQPGSVTDYLFANNASGGSSTDVAQSFTVPATDSINQVSLYLKKIGNPANATVRITADNNNKPSTSTLASGALVATNVGATYGYVTVAMSSNPTLTAGNRYWVVIDANANASNYWSWGSSSGFAGGEARNSSSFSGGSWSNPNTDFAFKVFTGGLATHIDNVRTGATTKANTLINSAVTGDAYYQTKTNTTVSGTSYPNSTDPPTQTMPVSDGNVEDFKENAAAGGTNNGDFPVDTPTTLGPLKIDGDLNVNSVLTMNGPIWVTGAVNFNIGSILKLTNGFGDGDSTFIVADGKITTSNNTQIVTAGPNSFIMLLSESLEGIDVSNNAQQSILVTRKGPLTVTQNAGAKALVAYRLELLNNVSIAYTSGVPNVDITGGPGRAGKSVAGKSIWNDPAL